MNPTAFTVPSLLLQGIRELRDVDESYWDLNLNHLIDELARLPLRREQVLREVVATSAVLQQFLIELAVRPSVGRPASVIFDAMESLVDELRRRSASAN